MLEYYLFEPLQVFSARISVEMGTAGLCRYRDAHAQTTLSCVSDSRKHLILLKKRNKENQVLIALILLLDLVAGLMHFRFAFS